MRGEIDSQMGLLTLTTPEKRVPADHPIREIKKLADAALKELDPVFDAMYAQMGAAVDAARAAAEGPVAARVLLDPVGAAVL